MADKTIAALTAATSLASGDELVLQNAGGNSRKITALNAAKSLKTLGFSGALVKKAADETTANYSAGAVVPWTAEEYDTDSYHDNSTNNSRLTAPADGYYRITACIRTSLHIADEFQSMRLLKNGAGFVGGGRQIIEIGATTSGVNMSSAVVALVAGDYVEISLDLESDTSVTIDAAESYFAIERVA